MSTKPAAMKHWVHAFRPRTLPLAVSGILTGTAMAASAALPGPGRIRLPVLTLALLTALLLQVLSNLANDLGDHLHGTDNTDRVGPRRAVQSGAITPSRMRAAMAVCASLALVSGTALVITALGPSVATLAFLLIGLAAIAAAVRYTFGTNPYGYAGLGDLSVFLFFGVAGVCGTFYLHARTLPPSTLLPAAAIGMLCTGVLNVNNMRDAINDAASGKRTLAVRMGAANARIYHTSLVVGGAACLVAFTLVTPARAERASWLFLAALPVLAAHLVRTWRAPGPHALDPQLKVLALGTLLTALLFSIGLILA